MKLAHAAKPQLFYRTTQFFYRELPLPRIDVGPPYEHVRVTLHDLGDLIIRRRRQTGRRFRVPGRDDRLQVQLTILLHHLFDGPRFHRITQVLPQFFHIRSVRDGEVVFGGGVSVHIPCIVHDVPSLIPCEKNSKPPQRLTLRRKERVPLCKAGTRRGKAENSLVSFNLDELGRSDITRCKSRPIALRELRTSLRYTRKYFNKSA